MRRALAGALVTVLCLGGVAAGKKPLDSRRQPLLDGCRRSFGETFIGTAPEWSYVTADRTPRRLEGIVSDAGPSPEDNPLWHNSYDYKWETAPDRGYEPYAATANIANEHGHLAIEWEENSFPKRAWPTDGDHVAVIGSWIWDCGHWGQEEDPREEPNAWIPYAEYQGKPGEETEIHPPRAVFTVRHNAADRTGAVSRADLYISSDGTPARTQEECGLSLGFDPGSAAVSTASAQERATGVAGGCSSWQPVNDQDYDFTMPLPPGGGPIRASIDTWQKVNAPRPVVTIDGTSARVHVPFKGYGEPAASITRAQMILGTTITIRRATPSPAYGIRVRLKSIRINKDLDTENAFGQGISAEPSEYNMYANISGHWLALHDNAPGMKSSRAGQRFALSTSVDVWIPYGAPLRILFSGRECDLPRMDPCSSTVELGFNDTPGEIEWISSDITRRPVGYARAYRLTSRGGTAGCGCVTIDFSVQRIAP